MLIGRLSWHPADLPLKNSAAGVSRILKRNGLNRLPRGARLRKAHTTRYQQQVPGHQIQVDVKFLIFREKDGKPIKRYQYTAIDETTPASTPNHRTTTCTRRNRKHAITSHDTRYKLLVKLVLFVNEKSGATLVMRYLIVAASIVATFFLGEVAFADTVKFKRIPTQFIAALAEPGASSGKGAEKWGSWRVDPGPRGVWLKDFEHFISSGGVAPADWVFDAGDWWLDENGLIMEKPLFPLSPGRYLVTGRRAVTAILTVHPADGEGSQAWELGNKATVHDVTHLKCRSARYTPVSKGSCNPSMMSLGHFPVAPGGVMPPLDGCNKQDYSVLFIIGVEWSEGAQAD